MDYKRSPVVKIDYMIQAQPNYFILDLVRNGPVKKTPIIAWGISDGIVHPVTINEIRGKKAPILVPNGAVFSSEENWPSLQDWEADVHERLQEK